MILSAKSSGLKIFITENLFTARGLPAADKSIVFCQSSFFPLKQRTDGYSLLRIVRSSGKDFERYKKPLRVWSRVLL
jgi:hypothetical protein